MTSLLAFLVVRLELLIPIMGHVEWMNGWMDDGNLGINEWLKNTI